MNEFRGVIILSGFFFFLTVSDSAAQSATDSASLFEGIKAEMTTVARENERLSKENEKLKARLVSLQLEVAKYKKENKGPALPRMQEQTPADRRQEPLDSVQPPDEALTQEAQRLYLSGSSMNIDAEQRLKELRMYDAQCQKQELQLDLQEKERLYEARRKIQQPRMEALQEEGKVNEERLGAMTRQIVKQEKAASVYPRQIELLKKQNEALERRVKKLKNLLTK